MGCSPWGGKESGTTERLTRVTCVISKETKAQSLSYVIKVTQPMSPQRAQPCFLASSQAPQGRTQSAQMYMWSTISSPLTWASHSHPQHLPL